MGNMNNYNTNSNTGPVCGRSAEGCPNCSSTLVDDIAFLAGGWMLGDWLGLWGDDD